MKVLVVGGAGYIGSHMVKTLSDGAHDPVVFDNLSTGHADAVPARALIRADLADDGALNRVFQQHAFDAVMHFASSIQVGESVRDPAGYYRNNVVNTLNLLDAMLRAGVYRFIFSSSAAIFGEPQYLPIDEAHPMTAINPYGMSKQMVERILGDYDRAYGLKSVCLRYFNAAGADPHMRLGERHEPETHLIPLLLQVASGRRASIDLFGMDYDTPDGTCIRDYVHVTDLCQAHLLALQRLMDLERSDAFNLGNGNGFSVRDVVAAVERVTRKPLNIVCKPRRAGDPARLVADAQHAKVMLGWSPQYTAIDHMVEHAWNWERRVGDKVPAVVPEACQ